MTAICPHCGYDLVKDEPIVIGAYRYVPRLGLFHQGRRIDLTGKGLEIAVALFRARGQVLTLDALALRLGNDSLSFSNLIAVYLNRMRSAWGRLGEPFPIERVRGRGLYWAGEPFGRGGSA